MKLKEYHQLSHSEKSGEKSFSSGILATLPLPHSMCTRFCGILYNTSSNCN